MELSGKKGLIFIEDGSFLLDNRVQREVQTLRRAGMDLVVICPRYPGERMHDILNGVHIYRYKKWKLSDGLLGHVGEYGSSLLKGSILALLAYVRHGFHLFHACNPPDMLFLIALPYKLLGVRFLFDHHDLCPELYLSRFKRPHRWIHTVLSVMERVTLRTADVVLATNESYKRLEIARAGIDAKRIFVVHNGPDLGKFKPGKASPTLRNLGKLIVGYLGNMNPQDGVEYLLLCARYLKEVRKRNDLYFVFVGAGDAYQDLVLMSKEWNIAELCHFTGRLPDHEMLETLNACDICVQPDPSNPLNDCSTMNKVMEYMALEKPVVAFDLPETRYSGGDAVLYARPNNIEDLAEKILYLADNPDVRTALGKKGRQRVEECLCWDHSERPLIDAYKVALGISVQG